jgi:hypothetical protein
MRRHAPHTVLSDPAQDTHTTPPLSWWGLTALLLGVAVETGDAVVDASGPLAMFLKHAF